MLYDVVQAVLKEVCGSQESHHRLGWSARYRNLVLYADNRHILGRDPYWVQEALMVTVDMFCRVGLKKNF